MEKPNKLWGTFHERTTEHPPSESLMDAVGLVAGRDAALDLGAGALRDSKFLLQNGFQSVTAVDSESATEEAADKLGDERLRVVIAPFQQFDFPENSFDLVNAEFSLPFTPPESFDEVFGKMKRSLKPGGIFVGELFGKNDSWSGNPKMTFHTLDDVRELLAGMTVLNLREEEKEDTPVVGPPKHWHIFYITARKDADALANEAMDRGEVY